MHIPLLTDAHPACPSAVCVPILDMQNVEQLTAGNTVSIVLANNRALWAMYDNLGIVRAELASYDESNGTHFSKFD